MAVAPHPLFMTKLIGIAGKARAGKDTAANALLALGYTRIRFADPLKHMVRALLGNAAFSMEEINDIIEGDQKQVPLDILCGKSGRFAMQTLGTEWGRDIIGKDLWVRIALAHAAGSSRVVIPDVRFLDEAAAIKLAGGAIVKITRATTIAEHADHSSELGVDDMPYDHLIINNSSIESLKQKIEEIEKTI